MSRKTRPVTSREYKIMLRADRFTGSKDDILASAKSLPKLAGTGNHGICSRSAWRFVC